MITDKIKALFNFIEFLHSNIDNYNNYNNLINELEFLKSEKDKLNPESNYKDKLKYNEIQTELESKFNTLQDNTANLIKAKAKKLNVCNFDKEPRYSFNGVEDEIHQLKENFNSNDLTEIFKHKNKYIEYRTNTHKTFLSLYFFFEELDEITKSLFDYFKDNEQNEFEAFETKLIEVNDISEAVELLQKGHSKFIIPTSNNNTKQRLSKSLSDINFFKIYSETNNKKEFNNDSFIKPENWNNLKDIFFTQRMDKYNSSFTQFEKIKLELEDLENLTINNTDYKILKERYKDFLNNELPKQNQTFKLTDFEKDQIFAEMVFEKGLYYYSDTHKSKIQQAYKNLENDFEAKEDFVCLVNRLLHSNGLHFYSRLRTITNETEFIKYIQSQYNLYNEYTPNNSLKWLNFTKKCIMYGFGILSIDNDNLKASFMNWYNETLKTITPEAPQQNQPQQPETNNPDVNFEFENNFDRVKNTAVYDFFKTKLVDKKYLTVNNLHSYLKVAFENQQLPQTKFSFDKKYLIKDIRKIFYNYFTEINTEKYSTQDRYIKLLTDYFEGFNFEKIKNNFNK